MFLYSCRLLVWRRASLRPIPYGEAPDYGAGALITRRAVRVAIVLLGTREHVVSVALRRREVDRLVRLVTREDVGLRLVPHRVIARGLDVEAVVVRDRSSDAAADDG